MLLGLLLISLAIMAAFPDTKVGKLLRRVLVEAPAAWLDRKKTVRAIVALVIVMAAFTIGQLAPELMMMVLMGGGEAAIWIIAFADSSVILEIMVLVWLATASGGLKTSWRAVKSVARGAAHFVRRQNKPRAARLRKSRPSARPARPSDDDPAPDFGFAFA